MKRKIIRIIAVLATIMTLFPAMVILMFQTDASRRYLAHLLESQSQAFINGSISIGAIEGTLWNDVQFSDFTVMQDGDTVLNADRLSLHFRLLPLLRGRVVVDSLLIVNPSLSLCRDSIQGLNVLRLLKLSEPGSVTSSVEYPYVDIRCLNINNLMIEMEGFPTILPTLIDRFSMESAIFMAGDSVLVRLDSMCFDPNNRWPQLTNLAFNLAYSPRSVLLSDFRLRTVRNRFEGSGVYGSDTLFRGTFSSSHPVAEEFEFLMPDLQLSGVDSVYFHFDNHHDMITFGAGIARCGQGVDVNGEMNHFAALVDDLGASAPFSVSVKIRNMNLQQWIPSTPSGLIINGIADIQGDGIDRNQFPIDLVADFKGSSYLNFVPQEFRLNGRLNHLDISGMMTASLQEGHLAARFKISDLQTFPFFDVDAAVNDINGRLLPFKTDVLLKKGRVKLSGSGKSIYTLNAQLTASLSDVLAYGQEVDRVHMIASAHDGTFSIDTLDAWGTGVAAHVSGDWNMNNDELKSAITVNLVNYALMHGSQSVNVDRGSVALEVSGSSQNLAGTGSMRLEGARLDSLVFGVVTAGGSGVWNSQNPGVDGFINLSDAAFGKWTLQNASLTAGYHQGKVEMALKADILDSLRINLNSSILTGDTVTVTIQEVGIGMPFFSFVNNETIEIRKTNDNYDVVGFELVDSSGNAGTINFSGRFSPFDETDMKLAISNFHMDVLRPFFADRQLPAGTCFLNLHLQGHPNSHKLKVDSRVDSLNFNGILVHRLSQSGYATNDELVSDIRIFNQAGESFLVKFNSKHQITQDSLRLIMTRQPVITLESAMNHLPLVNIIPKMANASVSRGLLSYHLLVSGQLDKPQVDGFVRVDDAALKIPAAGVDFNQLNFSMRALGESFVVDTLYLKTGKGRFGLWSKADFLSGLTHPPTNLDGRLKAEGFRLFRPNLFDVVLNSGATFQISDGQPVVDGSVTVLSSQINIDRLLQYDAPQKIKDEAFLVRALNLQKGHAVGANHDANKALSNEVAMYSIFGNGIKGRLNLSIPRNTWIKGDNMGLDLMGDLDMVMGGVGVELFGNLGVNRGFYNLFGRKLSIVRGDMAFQGGSTIDPSLDLEAQYVFRTADRTKRILHAKVGGKLSLPEVDFSLDGQYVSNSDAVGYLVFGKPMTELGMNSQQSVGSLSMTNAVSGLFTSELTKVLGNKLNLDVVEIEAGDNWQNASFVVGKYLSNNLFVIYQRAFGKAAESELASESVILEYELNPHLFFRLESGERKKSGLDVIIKFEQKGR